jgi:hypothetical protein
MRDLLKLFQDFFALLLSVAIPVTISIYCTATVPTDIKAAMSEQSPKQTQKLLEKISAVQRQTDEAQILIVSKQLELVEKKYNQLYKIAKACLKSENEILHLKNIEQHKKPDEKEQIKDTFKPVIKSKKFNPL